MIQILAFIFSFGIFQPAFSQSMQNKGYTYLALGDSYTVGENVPQQDNFPHQTVQLLNKAGHIFELPTIVAKTGWTTEELQWGIDNKELEAQYNFVSLLIGVNDQYRNGSIDEYGQHFERLVQKAVEFAGKNPSRVFIFSIPDWGVTPFAKNQDRELIRKAIDSFNLVNRSLSTKWKVNYIDITEDTREAASDLSLIAGDGLHPSAKEYKRWAVKLAAIIQEQLH